MKRWLPSPYLSAALLLCWLLLAQSLANTDLLLGLLLALAIPLLTRPLLPLPRARVWRPWLLFRLLASSMVEIVRSCFNVSRIILFRRAEGVNSQFIRVPLELRDPYGLALLSCLINCTPGTVWVELLPDTHDLALHVFDLHDEQWWIETIKREYEGPLMDIFEGGKS
ncbi:MAG TPA: Na+/H+ antiporter subunit E [Rhodocyclaceae bacterium]|nr:Na+/H+ antiporter subunit E [Rhodocyclaceae bacterium]